MRKRLLYLALLLAIAIPLALALQATVRGWIGNYLLRLYDFFRPAIEALPQAALWWLFILIAASIALLNLVGVERVRRPPQRPSSGGTVGRWQWWLEQATGRSPRRASYRWVLARNLAGLALEVLAHRERISTIEAQERLEKGELEVPSDVRVYLLAGLKRVSFNRQHDLAHLLPLRRRPTSFDLQPERVIRFLEENMEVTHDNAHR